MTLFIRRFAPALLAGLLLVAGSLLAVPGARAAELQQVGQFATPSTIDLTADGSTILQTAPGAPGAPGAIHRYNLDGSLVSTLTGNGQTVPRAPTAIATDPAGNIVVGEGGDGPQVYVISPAGQLVRRFGAPGYEQGQISYVDGLDVDSAGNVYVADPNPGKVIKYRSDGTFVTEWTLGKGSPAGIEIDAADNVFVSQRIWSSDQGAYYAVYKFDVNGNLLATFGDGSGTDSGLTDSVAVDPAGNVYTANHIFNIHVYDAQGTLLTTHKPEWNEPGVSGRVAGLAVNSQGILYAGINGNDAVIRLYVLGPGDDADPTTCAAAQELLAKRKEQVRRAKDRLDRLRARGASPAKIAAAKDKLADRKEQRRQAKEQVDALC